ncbi:MAG TPA: hypothetical protein VFK02_14065 [Kofleriaceae bacterium]|nr:hypothetical protein [Kofleriaceae bacterium]
MVAPPGGAHTLPTVEPERAREPVTAVDRDAPALRELGDGGQVTRHGLSRHAELDLGGVLAEVLHQHLELRAHPGLASRCTVAEARVWKQLDEPVPAWRRSTRPPGGTRSKLRHVAGRRQGWFVI